MKAYDYVLEAKKLGADDLQAVHEAAGKIWQEKKAEHDRRLKDHEQQSRERAELNRLRMQERVAKKKAEHPEPPGARENLPPKPPKPAPPPAYVADPETPLPAPLQKP